MNKYPSLNRNLTLFAFILISFASCKKNSESTTPPQSVLAINSFSPVTGSAGTVVTINGKNFSTTLSDNVVSFNGTVATATSATADKIVVTVPAGASTGKITVKVSTNSVASTNDFTVIPLLASFSIARAGLTATALNNKIYFGGGYDGTKAIADVDIYNVDSSKWVSAKLSVARFNFAAGSAGHKIVFAGGETDLGLPAPLSSVVDIYDDSARVWSVAHLSSPSHFLSAGSAGNKIIFGGGQVDTGVSNNVDIYDVVSNTWTAHALHDRRGYANIIGLGNKIVVAGGIDGYGSTTNLDYFFKSVDIYDVTTNSWSQANLGTARGGMGVAAAGNKIVFAGGYTKDTAYNEVLSSVVDIYDVSTGVWSTSSLATPAAYTCAAASGNKLLFVRDINFPGVSTGAVDVYDISSNSWSTGSLSEARTQMAAAGTGNKILFAGGFNPVNGLTNTVDIYDAISGAWSH